MMNDFSNLLEFNDQFNNEDNCRQYFESIRFQNGDFCPHCGHSKIFRFSDGKRYRCEKCRKDFTIKTGTLFGESKIPLQKWFIAIYLLTTRKKGISSIELAEQVGVSQKTAWFMDHRIREAMKQDNGKLFGTVETDETYIGGKEKNKHTKKRIKGTQGRSTTTKTPIMGMVQRGGKVRTTVLPDVKVKTIEDAIFGNVRKGSKIYSDDFISYRNLPKYYKHRVVKHRDNEYVRGDVHSNSVESFWALFKRGYHGTYHSMSKKHLQRYVDEFAFRFNNRTTEMSEKFAELVQQISNRGNVSYEAVIGEKAPQVILRSIKGRNLTLTLQNITRYEKRQTTKKAQTY